MRSILIIDDDPSVLRMFSSALAPLATVSTATTGKEGLELLEKQRFDALILDLHMPNVDGHAILDTLGSPKALNHHTPVYVATADDSTEARVKAMRRRGVFFLTKPVSIRMLVNLVETLFARSDRPPSPRK
ncbi:MAG: response regulator [Polyangiaceae bacterium]